MDHVKVGKSNVMVSIKFIVSHKLLSMCTLAFWPLISINPSDPCTVFVCCIASSQIFNCLIIIILMLAYLYCATYIRMTMYASSPPCEQRRITFNDDGQRMQLDRPELPASHFICMYRLLPTKPPHHRPGIITPDLLSVSIYRLRKDG